MGEVRSCSPPTCASTSERLSSFGKSRLMCAVGLKSAASRGLVDGITWSQRGGWEGWVRDLVPPGRAAEAAALRDGGCNPACSRLEPYVLEAATRGAHLLDRGLELRREVHGRHELIEREVLRRRHRLAPGRPLGAGLSGPRRSSRARTRQWHAGRWHEARVVFRGCKSQPTHVGPLLRG